MSVDRNMGGPADGDRASADRPTVTATGGRLHLLGVVAPVYDEEALIEEPYGRVCGALEGTFELVLVGDGSTDRSPEILERLPNGGSARTRRLPRAELRASDRAHGDPRSCRGRESPPPHPIDMTVIHDATDHRPPPRTDKLPMTSFISTTASHIALNGTTPTAHQSHHSRTHNDRT